MALTEQRKATPLYAVVGAGDLVAEKIRLRRLALDDRIERAQAAASRVKTVPTTLRALPERVQTRAAEAVDEAGEVYADLVGRGTRLVARIRNQESTERFERQAENTLNQAKGAATATKRTATTAKRSASTAKSRAKATATAAQRTATQAKEAAADAAAKVGD